MNMILIHSGAKGQKWGTRKYRNYDGTLTEEGKKRYDYYDNKTDRVYNSAKQKQSDPNKKYLKSKKWGVEPEDLSKYTVSELRALSDRAEAERRYRETFDAYRKSNVRQFLDYSKKFLKGTAAVVGAIATISKTIENINKLTGGVTPKKPHG